MDADHPSTGVNLPRRITDPASARAMRDIEEKLAACGARIERLRT